jgi:hypothetical protein
LNSDVEYISRAWYREIPLALQELGQRQTNPEDRRLLQIAAHKTYIIMAHYETIEERNATLTHHITHQVVDATQAMKVASEKHAEELQGQIKQLNQQVNRLTASQRGNRQGLPSVEDILKDAPDLQPEQREQSVTAAEPALSKVA